MALGSWEPAFSFDDGSGGGSDAPDAMVDITALYDCLKIALGSPVEMNDGRQSSTSRRKSKDDIERTTNDGISYQAAKMTKCIVNYMASGADSTVFEQENLLRTFSAEETYGDYFPGAYEVFDITGIMDGDFVYMDEDSENIVDLYWEINYMKAPLATISITEDPPE
jgi:hypothetical protein